MFFIYNEIGIVKVIGNLKYEYGKVYYIIVEVIDKGDIFRYVIV